MGSAKAPLGGVRTALFDPGGPNLRPVGPGGGPGAGQCRLRGGPAARFAARAHPGVNRPVPAEEAPSGRAVRACQTRGAHITVELRRVRAGSEVSGSWSLVRGAARMCHRTRACGTLRASPHVVAAQLHVCNTLLSATARILSSLPPPHWRAASREPRSHTHGLPSRVLAPHRPQSLPCVLTVPQHAPSPSAA